MRKGFTMIELVFTIIIVGILSYVALIHIPAKRLDACIADMIAGTSFTQTAMSQASMKALMLGIPMEEAYEKVGITKDKLFKKTGFSISEYKWVKDKYYVKWNWSPACERIIYRDLSYEDMYLIQNHANPKARTKLPKGEQHFYPNEPSPDWIKANKDRI